MAKVNKRGLRTMVNSAIKSETTPSGRTFNGAAGYARDAKSELFLLAVSNFVSEGTFYESGNARDERFERLVAQVAVEDSEWLLSMITWLRSDANMRSASIVAACVAVKARLDNGDSGNTDAGGYGSTGSKFVSNRKFIDVACQRADELGEVMAYWLANFGKPVPSAVKRGLSDAAARLLNERSFMKYDSANAAVRIGDVVDYMHTKPNAAWKSDLYRHAIEKRQKRDAPIPESLSIIKRRDRLNKLKPEQKLKLMASARLPEILNEAGMTWESLSSWGVMDKAAWEAIIPSMGYMALLRNLRNFDEAGVSDKFAEMIYAKLSDPAEVAKSRQLPYRFYTAYRMVNTNRWGHALDKALSHSMANVPFLKGRTLILVDTSRSMRDPFSKDGTVMRWDAATLFGVAFAQRCENVDLYSFSSTDRIYRGDKAGKRTMLFPVIVGESLLKSLDRWKSDGYFLDHGTETYESLKDTFAGHDRVIVITDEQADPAHYHYQYNTGDVNSAIPSNVPMYTWNLAGYTFGHAPSGTKNRHTFGGLNDKAFQLIGMLESFKPGVWPWDSKVKEFTNPAADPNLVGRGLSAEGRVSEPDSLEDILAGRW